MSYPRPFGAYVLEEYLAAGGMAEVYVARRQDNPGGLPICIKRVLPSFLQSKDFLTMFQDEAALASRLDHENVVRVFDFGAAEGTVYMAMEYVDGVDLATVVKGTKKLGVMLSVAQALEITIQICRGLHHAHTLTVDGRPLRVVHRDVSPQNVLLDRKGRVKVTDFGIAKAHGRETHTRTGVVKGKLGYMAPEQALGEELDHRTDQFAAGVVLWELLTAQRLFQERSELATLEKILTRPTDPPSRYRPHVPAEVDAVVLRALAKGRQERFSDMAAFEGALQRCLLSLPAATSEVRLDEILRQVRALSPRGARAPSSPSAPAASSTKTQPTPASALEGLAAPPQAVTAAHAPAVAAPGQTAFAPTVALGSPAAPPAAPAHASPSLLVTGAGQVPPAADPGGSFRVLSADAAAASSALPAFDLTPGGGAIPWAGEEPAALPSTTVHEQGFGRPAAALFVALGLVVGAGIGFFAGSDDEAPCALPAKSAQQRVMATTLHDAIDISLAGGDLKTSARDLEKALKLHGSARGYTQLGKLHTQMGNLAGALDAYRCVVLLEPDSKEAKEIRRKLTHAAAEP